MTKVVIYARVSTKTQDYDRQLVELREYARKMEYEVVAEFTEKIQNLLFPSGILWDKEKGNYRTFDENKALLIMSRLSKNYINKKEENSFENSSSVNLCG